MTMIHIFKKMLAVMSVVLLGTMPLAVSPSYSASTALSQEAEESPLDLMNLPIYQGFSLLDEATLVFDKAEGRIIQAEIEGVADEALVRQFYDQTLSSLGWQLDGRKSEAHHRHYSRDQEHLSLEYERDGDYLNIRFYLHPKEKR